MVKSFVYHTDFTNKSHHLSIYKYLTFHDIALKKKYRHTKIPFETLLELYFKKKVEFNCDLLEAFEHRHEYSTMRFTLNHVKTFLQNIVPECWHSRQQDETQVRDHYERGNDFYSRFLGPSMVYTSGIVKHEDETLEEVQNNKLQVLANKIQLTQDDDLLDIGCGWGTWAIYAAEHCDAKSVGVTLSRPQHAHAQEIISKKNLNTRILIMDYRDIPTKQYDKITCIEMAEHVGIRKFSGFLDQVSTLLKDDGIFLLQIAGLRRAWQWEDFVWGLFMGKYVFPGADASCPLGWVVNKLEASGFEIADIETIGIHYSFTIQKWYENWLNAEEYITNNYSGRLYRIWKAFLAWSVIIARQGNSTCYQIVCHKNSNKYPRRKFVV